MSAPLRRRRDSTGPSLCGAALSFLCSLAHARAASSSPFQIIIDGGSTGSRLHVFEFVHRRGDGTRMNATVEANDARLVCLRRGSARVDEPLTAHAADPVNAASVAGHVAGLLEYAATVVPSEFRPATRVLYRATAGMRLLTPERQAEVYDAMYRGLKDRSDLDFDVRRDDLATLGGEAEAFYGAVAANYLRGVVDAEMNAARGGPSTIGALDMGGSSTQIVYRIKGNDETCEVTDEEGKEGVTVEEDMREAAKREATRGSRKGALREAMREADYYSTSYLSYGVDQFRERLWNTLVAEREECPEDTCVNTMIPNPCANRGYEREWKGFTLIGVGDVRACTEQVRRLIPHAREPLEEHVPGTIGGIVHPPLRPNSKWVAMSLYFFTLDSLRVLSGTGRAVRAAWPTPTLDELRDALDGLCGRDWHGDLEAETTSHRYTRPHVLPHRCLESVYLITLLRDGFGFDPTARDITFAFDVGGNEVEWTLGMALAMRNKEAATRTSQDDEAYPESDEPSESGVTRTRADDEEPTESQESPENSNDNRSDNETDDSDGMACQHHVCQDQNRNAGVSTFFSEWIWTASPEE